jgi:hypothetical protein
MLGSGMVSLSDLGLCEDDGIVPIPLTYNRFRSSPKRSKRQSGDLASPLVITPPPLPDSDSEVDDDQPPITKPAGPGALPSGFHSRRFASLSVAAVAEFALDYVESCAVTGRENPDERHAYALQMLRYAWPASNPLFPFPYDAPATTSTAETLDIGDFFALLDAMLPGVNVHQRRRRLSEYAAVRRSEWHSTLPVELQCRWQNESILEMLGGKLRGKEPEHDVVTASDQLPTWMHLHPQNGRLSFTKKSMAIIQRLQIHCNLTVRHLPRILHYAYFFFFNKIADAGTLPAKSTIMHHFASQGVNAVTREKEMILSLMKNPSTRFY